MKELIRNQEELNGRSLAAVAKRVGMSTATVSRVLNNSPGVKSRTRQMVLRAIHETGIAPRSHGKVHTVIGVAVPDFHPNLLDNTYLQASITGIAESAVQQGFSIQPMNFFAERQPGETYAELVLRLGIGGLIHIGPWSRFYDAIKEIADTGFPQCLISARVSHPGVNWFDVENTEASRKAIRYLQNLGHRRIAIVTPDLTTDDQMERYEGYRLAMADAGIEIDPEFAIKRGDVNPNSGTSATLELLTKSNRPTAIFYTNGELAFGGIKACNKLGLAIPRDISIVSFDDSRLSEFLTPALTYLFQPAFEMGRRAGQCLASHMKHKGGKATQEMVIPDFFINESTGPAGQEV